MKYVIGTNNKTCHYVPVVFPDDVSHHVVGRALTEEGLRIMSAGFVYIDKEVTVDMTRRSESLDTGPGANDQTILRLFLKQGLGGLELSNMLGFVGMLVLENKG